MERLIILVIAVIVYLIYRAVRGSDQVEGAPQATMPRIAYTASGPFVLRNQARMQTSRRSSPSEPRFEESPRETQTGQSGDAWFGRWCRWVMPCTWAVSRTILLTLTL